MSTLYFCSMWCNFLMDKKYIYIFQKQGHFSVTPNFWTVVCTTGTEGVFLNLNLAYPIWLYSLVLTIVPQLGPMPSAHTSLTKWNPCKCKALHWDDQTHMMQPTRVTNQFQTRFDNCTKYSWNLCGAYSELDNTVYTHVILINNRL
jgi:hypothetical protein